MWTALVSWGETLGFMDVFFLRRRADRIPQLSSHHTMVSPHYGSRADESFLCEGERRRMWCACRTRGRHSRGLKLEILEESLTANNSTS